MTRTAKHYLVLLLGLWIAFAPVMSSLTAAAMAMQPGMSGETGYSRNECCPDGETGRDVCKLMCMNAGLYAITSAPDRGLAGIGFSHEPQLQQYLHAISSGPDPAPPRSSPLL